MKRLPRGYKIDRCVFQTSRLRSPIDALVATAVAKQLLAGLPHFGVGLNGKYFVSVVQKPAGQISRSGTDIGDHRARSESTMGPQYLDDLRRVARAILHVVVDAVRETCQGVFGRHLEDLCRRRAAPGRLIDLVPGRCFDELFL